MGSRQNPALEATLWLDPNAAAVNCAAGGKEGNESYKTDLTIL